MGKIAKRRRTELRKIKQREQRLIKTANDNHAAFVRAADQLQRIRDNLARFCAASIVEDPTVKLPPGIRHYQATNPNALASARFFENYQELRHERPETLLEIIAVNRTMAERFARSCHFRVTHAATGETRNIGYSITETALKMMRLDRSHFINLVAHSIAGEVHRQLFGEKVTGK